MSIGIFLNFKRYSQLIALEQHSQSKSFSLSTIQAYNLLAQAFVHHFDQYPKFMVMCIPPSYARENTLHLAKVLIHIEFTPRDQNNKCSLPCNAEREN